MSDTIVVPDPNSLEGRVAGFTEIGLLGHDSDEVSDGWHTFGELYHYRMLYNAGMVNALVKLLPGNARNEPFCKSWRHSDGELCFGKDNYFVVVMQLPTGQVSNHYKGEHWDLFKVPEVDRAPEYDGHTPQHAAERLEKYLRGDY